MKTKSTLKEKNANYYLTHTKNSKGITLIALVITIVILIILASVVMKLSLSNDGIFKKAKLARNNYQLAANEEQAQLANLAAYIDGEEGEVTEETTTPTVPTVPTVSEVELNVGTTVNYTPVTDNSFTIPSYPSLTSGTGGVSVDTDEANANYLTWKVWKKEGNNYLITPTTPTTKKIKLYGANGYNNAVQALNAYCRKYYSDTANGVYARSIKIEDLEGAMTTAGQTAKTTGDNSNYNTTITPTSNSKYPKAYDNEIGGGGTQGLSDAPVAGEGNEYAVWSGNATSTSGKSGGYKVTSYNFYNASINNATTPYFDEITRSLMFSSTGYGSGFWVASRCVSVSSSFADFAVRIVYASGSLDGYIMFGSGGSHTGEAFALRPVVSISSSQMQKYISSGH